MISFYPNAVGRARLWVVVRCCTITTTTHLAHNAPDPSDTNPFRYSGEYWDGETGTYYLRARNYSPATGRFLTEDPAQAGLNWYSYCGNNPVAFVDPLGLDAILINKAVDNAAKCIGVEHMSAFFQDENNDWWYFSWEKEVFYKQVDDVSIFDSLDAMNAWIVRNKMSAGENPYRDSVYIKGDFTASNSAASDYYDAYDTSTETWDGKGLPNQEYNVVIKNCGQVAVELFGMGTLPGGLNVRTYMMLKGHQNEVVPNCNMTNIQNVFYNKSTNLAGFNAAMQTQRAKYEGKSAAAQMWYWGLKVNIDAIS